MVLRDLFVLAQNFSRKQKANEKAKWKSAVASLHNMSIPTQLDDIKEQDHTL